MAKLFPGDATSAYPEDRSLLEREMDKILSPRTQNVAKVRRYLSTFVGPKTVRTRRRKLRASAARKVRRRTLR